MPSYAMQDGPWAEDHNRYSLVVLKLEVVGLNPTKVRDFFSFPVWAHFLSRAINQKVIFGIFII